VVTVGYYIPNNMMPSAVLMSQTLSYGYKAERDKRLKRCALTTATIA
jgi:hypothetical protein